jgi:uncharacterized protein (DUF1697 family)
MLRQVALLRGVNNPGSARRIAMADLRAIVEAIGCRDVRTVLNSGNVVFSVPNDRRADVAAPIERSLASKMGVPCGVTILSAREIAAILRDNPFADIADNPSRLLVMVPRERSHQRRLQPLLKQRWHPEAMALGTSVAYLWCANGVADSALWPAVDRALDRTGTARNIATMTRLLALVEGRT